jgi:hypothetical protein
VGKGSWTLLVAMVTGVVILASVVAVWRICVD